tara:strand:- start:2230 stop:2904 length:675 start_codon:yes stop_codon:yes gene_type:complete
MASIEDKAALEQLRMEFSKQFSVSEPRAYGREGSRHEGFSDDADGVQWNAGLDRGRNTWTLGVNLEGMKYGKLNWPIARFIEVERQAPALPWLIKHLSHPSAVELWFEREAWQAAARPAIKESAIGPEPPVLLSELNTETWLKILTEAYECLDPLRGHRGRRKQMVTLSQAGPREKEVTPHLQFKTVLTDLSNRSIDAALEIGRNTLLPLYTFVRLRVTCPNGT